MLSLRLETDPSWVERVRADFTGFLQDHAACERKAQATAMSLIANYPERIALVDAMAKLATEELEHFCRVHAILRDRGEMLGQDKKSPYVTGLRSGLRRDAQWRLIDRLLVAGLIEARSCERLGLVSREVATGHVRDFYRELAICEAGHHAAFVLLAKQYADEHEVDQRLDQLLDLEAEVLRNVPPSACVHG